MDELINFLVGKNQVGVSGFYFNIEAVSVNSREDGIRFLSDINNILKKDGSDDTYSFAHQYEDIELTAIIFKEMIK